MQAFQRCEDALVLHLLPDALHNLQTAACHICLEEVIVTLLSLVIVILLQDCLAPLLS